MSKTRNLSDLLDANGDVKSTALDNVPASNDASALTTGTLDNARLPTNITVGGNLTVTGNIASGTNGVSFSDNEKALFGTSDDLEIYHDGTDSLIVDNGSGKIQVRSNGDNIEIASSKTVLEKMANFVCDGASELYYDGSKKFETTSSGVSVTGDLSVSGSISGAGKVGQVVFNHTSTRATYTMTGSGVTDITPLNTSITPTSTSSKVLIQIQISCEANHDGVFRLFRGSTEIGRNSNSTSRWSGFAYIDYDPDFNSTANTFFFQYVDSPSTTSSTQYKLAVGKSDGNNGTLNFNRCNGGTGADNQEIATSSMTLTEILP
jgi:hypothetical protein